MLAKISLSEGAALDEVQTRLDEEIAGSWRLLASGALREIYATDDPRRVVFVLEVADLDAARAALATLPLIRSGHFSVELTELRPFANWRRLFSVEARNLIDASSSQNP